MPSVRAPWTLPSPTKTIYYRRLKPFAMELPNFASLAPFQQEQILNSPALRPPPGIQPNFDHPPNANHIVYPTIIWGLLLSSTFLLLRIHGRWYCMKTVKVQDILGIVAFLLFVAELAIYFEQIRQPNARGLFVHQWNLRIRDLRPFLLRSLILIHLYAGMMLLLKTAILIEWLQTFSPKGQRGRFYWACVGTMMINGLYWTIGIVIVDLECVPYEAIYDKTVPGRCLAHPRVLDVFANAFNLATDLVILGLPQGVIWKLRMSAMRRLGLSFVFAVGILACISAGARLVYTVGYLNSEDVTYSYSSVALWTVAEVTCGFIVFSVTGISKSFTSFKHSRLFTRLGSRFRLVPSGHGIPQKQGELMKQTSSWGDNEYGTDPYRFAPLNVSTSGGGPQVMPISFVGA
ncbi:hypothetical protein F5Y03DRAFT_365031 [Xylaria venustula]|nr:hypothetical protein F5Y03DRAFT_365031 [Xylaria venustula]